MMSTIIVLLSLILITMVFGRGATKGIIVCAGICAVVLLVLAALIFAGLAVLAFLKKADIPLEIFYPIGIILFMSFGPMLFKRTRRRIRGFRSIKNSG